MNDDARNHEREESSDVLEESSVCTIILDMLVYSDI
jgi:hypothetical protein